VWLATLTPNLRGDGAWSMGTSRRRHRLWARRRVRRLRSPPMRGDAHDTRCTMSTVRRITEKKREANRRNAQLSTGPKTFEGKERVARNALKHGLLARDVIIVAGDGKEN